MKHIAAPFKAGIIIAAALAGNTLAAQQTLSVTVKNALGFNRHEVVSVSRDKLTPLLKGKTEQDISVKDKATGTPQVLQWVDYNGDGRAEELLFMADVTAKGASHYVIGNDGAKAATPEIVTFSRFVPERTDDYTWENDKVAFRTYGPDAQMRTEKHLENGTLSSGIDIWLKRTPQPVINKWYKGYLTDPLYYHKDRGEGYDPYHVGGSRGNGGTGVWEKDSLLVSKNFTNYKTIATGPLRTVFELTYAPYSAYNVKETKRISLDLGTNFSKFEISYNSAKAVPNFALGITLHENEGSTEVLADKGIFAHHEKIDGAYVGEGIVINPAVVQKAFAHKAKAKDQSNLIVLTKPAGKVTYYAGFAWEKGGQAKDTAGWDELLKKQAEIIASPLAVSFN